MKPRTSSFVQCLTICLTALTFQNAHAGSATWTGGAATNILNTATNWTAGGPPTASGDTATWNGTVAGDLILTRNAGDFGVSGGGTGTNINITSGQTSSLLIGSSSTTSLFNGDNFNFGNLTIASGAGAFTFGDGIGNDNTVFRNNGTPLVNLLTNDSSNTATFGSNVYFNSGTGNARTFTFGGSGNWQVNSLLRFSNNSPMTIIKNGAGTLTLAGSISAGGTGSTTYTINAGTLRVAGTGLLGGPTLPGNITNNAAFSYESSASQTISGIVSGSGTVTQTAGNLTLTSVNTYGGATTINGGTLTVSGTGSINSSSGITVNGPSARYLHTSSTASDKNITLTQGTVAGTGTISAVTVASGSGQVANGNGNSASLTIDNLAYNGAGGMTITEDGDSSSSGIVVSNTLTTTPANGQITVNATSSFWDSGVTYNLISAGSFSGSLTDFTKGTIVGLTGRQNSSLVLNGTTLGLFIGGDNPKWSGLDSSNWVAGNTGANGNWKLIAGGTATDYVQGDVVLFDDSATNKTVTISAAGLSPAVVNFNNSFGNDYTINGAFGITAGALNKNGTGNVTIQTVNSHLGGTTVTAGTLTVSGAGTFGASSGTLTGAGGTVDLGGTSQTVGTLAISGESVIQNGTLNASGLIASNPTGSATISSSLNLGSGSLNKSGAGTLTLSGATAYSGATTVSGGILALSDAGTLGSTSGVTLSGGSLDLGGSSQSTNAVTISAASLVGDTLTNGTITPASFSYTATSGVATVSASIAGSTGITATGTANVSGTLTLTGENTFTGPLNFTGPATVRIGEGSNTGGGAINFNSFSSRLVMAGGSYATSVITSSGNSNSRFLELIGGTLESAGNIYANNLAIQVSFNGGTLKSTNASGITVFDFDNTIPVFGIGGTFDTTIGNVTIGKNSNASAGTNLPRITGAGTGSVSIIGGGSLSTGFQYTGTLEIQNNSTWNLNGVASTVGGLSGDGFVTNLPGSTVLTTSSDSSYTYTGKIVGGGNISLMKQGTGTQVLSGDNANLGNTTVDAGTLDVMGNSAATFSDAATVSIVTGAVLNLSNSVVDRVASLVIDGIPLAPGTYGAGSVGVGALITGNGQLEVVAGFANWMSQFATLSAADRLATADPDADGINNLLEYAIDGQDPTVPNASVGSFNGSALSFTKRSGTFGLTYSIVDSTDLGISDPWAEVTGGSYVNDATTISYTLTPGSPVKNFVRLQVVSN